MLRHTSMNELINYCAVTGQFNNRTGRPQRQERRHLNSFPLPVRLGVQFLMYLINLTC